MTRLIETPDTSKPLGMRNRAILEVMCKRACELGELIEIKLGDLHLSIGLLQTIGKGDRNELFL